MKSFPKYKQNLKDDNGKIYSYSSHVATVSGSELLVKAQFEKYSRTTSKHINYVAAHYGLTKRIVAAPTQEIA